MKRNAIGKLILAALLALPWLATTSGCAGDRYDRDARGWQGDFWDDHRDWDDRRDDRLDNRLDTHLGDRPSHDAERH